MPEWGGGGSGGNGSSGRGSRKCHDDHSSRIGGNAPTLLPRDLEVCYTSISAKLLSQITQMPFLFMYALAMIFDHCYCRQFSKNYGHFQP